jgi:serine protease Do
MHLLKRSILLAIVTLATMMVVFPKCQLLEISASSEINSTSSLTSSEKERSIDVYKNVKDSVVRIDGIYQSANKKITINNEPIKDLPFRGFGSGFFVYDSSGKIVTNHHVIEDAQVIFVTLSNGNRYSVKVIGDDPVYDLAVLQIDQSALSREKLIPIPIADPSTFRIGQPVVAIGSPLGFTNSLTQGIISHTGRINLDLLTRSIWLGGFIQTDAAITFGNSGGPLLNLNGEVVGVNDWGPSDPVSGGATALGFAISAGIVNKVVPHLISDGKYPHPWIGITIADVTPFVAEKVGLNQTSGVLVMGVTPESPAELSGVKPQDIILNVDNVTIKEISEIIEYLGTKIPGDGIVLNIVRSDGTEHAINLHVGTLDNSTATIGNSTADY